MDKDTSKKKRGIKDQMDKDTYKKIRGGEMSDEKPVACGSSASSAQSIKNSTTIKHTDFVSNPIKQKDVKKLPGIGKISGEELEKKGFNKARKVLGQFLILDEDKEKFMDWLMSQCGSNKKEREDCYNALKTWCDHHL